MLGRIPVKITATAKLSEEHILLDILTQSGTPSHLEEISIGQAALEGTRGCDLESNGLNVQMQENSVVTAGRERVWSAPKTAVVFEMRLRRKEG